MATSLTEREMQIGHRLRLYADTDRRMPELAIEQIT